MRFIKGKKVEVMNKAEVPVSWRSAEIVSGNGRTYTVKYASCSPIRSEAFEEMVSKKMIRPCPPVVHPIETLVAGDIVEVHVDFSWKVAIVLNVLQRDHYMVRLLGSSLELSLHKSEVRYRLNWKEGKWVFIRKICAQDGTMKYNRSSAQDCSNKMKLQPLHLDTLTKVQGETDGLAKQNDNRGQESYIISSRSLKRSSPYCSTGVDSLNGNGKKQRVTAVALREKVDAVTCPRGILGENYMHTSFNIRSNGFNELERADLDGVFGCSPPRSSEPSNSDSDACSVGSCSVTSERPNKLFNYIVPVPGRVSRDLGSDAESVCGSGPSRYEEKNNSYPPEEELATSVHRLELHAYSCTLKALYASGPLTWEQEALISNLRITLHISDDEHLMELKNLLSSKSTDYIR